MDKPSHKSALHERESAPGSPSINPKSGEKIKAFRKKELPADELVRRLIAGDKAALGRAITLIESIQPNHLEDAQKL